MRKHSVNITGHQTSLSIEDEFWEELKRIARQKNVSVSRLIEEIDNNRQGNLSGAIRVYILNALKKEIPDNKKS